MVYAECLAQEPGSKGASSTEEKGMGTFVSLWLIWKLIEEALTVRELLGNGTMPQRRAGPCGKELAHPWELSTETMYVVELCDLKKAIPVRPLLPAEGVLWASG